MTKSNITDTEASGISKERVEAIAKLARLELDDNKATLFAEQFDSILGYMDTLNELDTTDVEPLFSPVMHETVFRKDEAVKHATREEILSNAPEDDGQFFVVPRIV